MERHIIQINWSDPQSIDNVIAKMTNGGNESNKWSGKDYGVYQIYGTHILCEENTLLYVGQAADQTFSQRFKQHEKEWLKKEKNIQIYLGRIENTAYTDEDNWLSWRRDVDIAESILIYKYTPHYNSANLWQLPQLRPYTEVQLLHTGNKNKLMEKDIAPKDYE